MLKVLLPRGDGYQRALIMHHKWDLERNLTRQQNVKPMLDTRVYTVEIPDWESIEIALNTAENFVFDNFDADGNKFMLFNSIIYHKSTDKVVKKSDW